MILFYTHLKIVFGKNPKTILPLPTGRQASKVLGAFCPGITATKIWFFGKPKTKPVLVYLPTRHSGGKG
jgi:hypothetical protein